MSNQVSNQEHGGEGLSPAMTVMMAFVLLALMLTAGMALVGLPIIGYLQDGVLGLLAGLTAWWVLLGIALLYAVGQGLNRMFGWPERQKRREKPDA